MIYFRRNLKSDRSSDPIYTQNHFEVVGHIGVSDFVARVIN